MRKLLSVIAVLSFVSAAHAQSTFTERLKEGSDTVRLFMGSNQGAQNFGLDWERRAGPSGLGVFLQQTAKRSVSTLPSGATNPYVLSRPEMWIGGFYTPLHLVDKSNFDITIAPALAIIGAKDVGAAPDNKDIVTFGPALKIGAMYYFHQNWSAGLDFMTITNWFSDRLPGQDAYANFAVGYTF